MALDDSFKKPGSVPFKWEIRPGVPKIQHKQQPKQLSPPTLPSPSPPFNLRRPSPSPSPIPTSQPQIKLKPPPAGFIYLPPLETRTHSFRSTPRTRSERWRFDRPTRVSPECVSPGCFPSPLLKRKDSKRRTRTRTTHNDIPVSEYEADYISDLETLSRWSSSSRKSFSQFHDSSYSSSQSSSPQLVSDAEWAGFGLF